MANQIRIKHLQKTYEENLVIDDFSLTIEPHKIAAVCGPSGAGITTLANLLSGFEDPDEGTIEADGEKAGFSLLRSAFLLHLDRTVVENYRRFLGTTDLGPSERKARAEEVARLLDLNPEAMVSSLSAFERAKAHLGRGLLLGSSCLILEEAFREFDKGTQAEMRRYLLKLVQKVEMGLLLLTHNPLDAAYADEILVLRHGKTVQRGSLREIYRQPKTKFVAAYFGRPPMNFLYGSHKDGKISFVSGLSYPVGEEMQKKIESRYGKEPALVVVAIRPEDIHEAVGEFADAPYAGTAVASIDEKGVANRFLHLEYAETTIIAKVSMDSLAAIGSPIRLAFDFGKAILFDPKTEEAI